jgi:hypothetical protein
MGAPWVGPASRFSASSAGLKVGTSGAATPRSHRKIAASRNRAPQPIRKAEWAQAGTWSVSQIEGIVRTAKKKGTVAKRRPSPSIKSHKGG